MNLHTFFSAFLLSSCAATCLSGANLVTNGSFEQGALGIGSFQGWQTSLGDISTFVDSSGRTGPLYGDAFEGSWAAYLGSSAANGGASLSQTLSTIAGQRYLLTFELANDNGGLAAANRFNVTVGSQQAFSFANLANQAFQAYQFSFVASGTQTSLAFFGSNDNSYLELDSVGVTSTPEPTPGALAFFGLAVLCASLGLSGRPKLCRRC